MWGTCPCQLWLGESPRPNMALCTAFPGLHIKPHLCLSESSPSCSWSAQILLLSRRLSPGSNAITKVSRLYRLNRLPLGAYHCQHELQAGGCLRLCPDVKSSGISFACGMLSGHAAEQQWSQFAANFRRTFNKHYLHQHTGLNNVSLEDVVLIKEVALEGH